MQPLMVIAHAGRQQRRLDECLMVRMMQVVWAGEIVNRMLVDVGRDLRRNWNLLDVIFRHVKLQTFAGRENFPTLRAFEGRRWRALVQMNLPLVHHHVAVPGESLVANVALEGRKSWTRSLPQLNF